jgi:secreted trypsin-like serine protease
VRKALDVTAFFIFFLQIDVECAMAQHERASPPDWSVIQESTGSDRAHSAVKVPIPPPELSSELSPEAEGVKSPSSLHKYPVTDEPPFEVLSPAFKKGITEGFAEQQQQQDWIKIRDGIRVPDKQLPDCVAVGVVGTRRDFDCSGVLIAEQLVLTAGHCGDKRRPTDVLFGSNVQTGRVAKVKKSVPHELYKPDIDLSEKYVQPLHDLMLLILVERQAVPPAKLAGSGQLTKQNFRNIRVVGFGFTDQFKSSGNGIKRMGDVPVVSTECAPDDNILYGCKAGLEFVAKSTPGADGKVPDQCGGDSGGPAYILVDQQAKEVAGIVSRSTKNRLPGVPCGDGGIYERVPEALEWIRRIASENGVKSP